jgi:hypothetical protein
MLKSGNWSTQAVYNFSEWSAYRRQFCRGDNSAGSGRDVLLSQKETTLFEKKGLDLSSHRIIKNKVCYGCAYIAPRIWRLDRLVGPLLPWQPPWVRGHEELIVKHYDHIYLLFLYPKGTQRCRLHCGSSFVPVYWSASCEVSCGVCCMHWYHRYLIDSYPLRYLWHCACLFSLT